MEIFNTLSDVKLGTMSLSSLLSAVLLFIVCFIVIKALCRVFGKMMNKSKHMDASLKSFFTSAIKVALWSVAVIIIAGSLGIPVTSLVAILSVAGVALSLALQGLLANIFSGITILITSPFKVGDFIEAGGQIGTVKAIGMFHTTIDTLDNRLVYIPNGDVAAASIVNFSAEETRMVERIFKASYESETEDVRKAILDAIAMDDRILADHEPFIVLSEYGTSCVEYMVRVWCKGADYWGVYFALNENVRECFKRNGVAMSYEHLNVHIAKD